MRTAAAIVLACLVALALGCDDRSAPHSSPPSPPGGAAAKLVLAIKPDAGLRAGDRFYPLGSSSKEFISTFGPPQHRSREGELLSYYDDGFFIAVDHEGNIKAVTIYLTKAVGEDGTYDGGRITVDNGITASSTHDAISKLCGRANTESGDAKRKTLYFDWGWVTLKQNLAGEVTIHRDSLKSTINR